MMTAKLKSPATAHTLLSALKKWEERNVSGFQGSYLLAGDDDETIRLMRVVRIEGELLNVAG